MIVHWKTVKSIAEVFGHGQYVSFCNPVQFRRVIDKIRGRSYADALYNLTKLPYRAVEEITEVLKSVSP